MKFKKIADLSFSARVNFLSYFFSKKYFSVSRNLPRKIIGGGLNIIRITNILSCSYWVQNQGSLIEKLFLIDPGFVA